MMKVKKELGSNDSFWYS